MLLSKNGQRIIAKFRCGNEERKINVNCAFSKNFSAILKLSTVFQFVFKTPCTFNIFRS